MFSGNGKKIKGGNARELRENIYDWQSALLKNDYFVRVSKNIFIL
jgi:hypothetical protein